MHRSRFLYASALAIMASTAAVAAPADDRAAQADRTVAQAMAAAPFPGAAVAVARRGRVIYAKGFGVADREANTPVTAATRFPIGSITKPVTCLSVLQLIDRGRVTLDAPVSLYLPALPEPSRGVTIRQLLEHSAGVPNYLENRDFPYARPTGLSRQDMLGYFAAKPLLFAPGTQFNYSNSDTYLLGLVVEAASGTSYDHYVANQIFAPFGMTHSDFGADPDHAKGYQTRAGAVKAGTTYDWLVPFSAGAIVSTAGDLVRFADGLFGRTTPPSVRRMALSGDTLADGSANRYLKGCLIEGDLDGRRKVSHPGSIYGFSSHLAYYPDDKLTVVVLTNGQGENFPALTLEHQVARIFLGLPAPDLSGRPFDAAEAGWIAGDYTITNRRLGFDKLGFVAADGALNLRFGGTASGAPLVKLIPLGGGRYASSADPEQRFAFVRGGDGGVTLTLRYYEADFTMRRVAG